MNLLCFSAVMAVIMALQVGAHYQKKTTLPPKIEETTLPPKIEETTPPPTPAELETSTVRVTKRHYPLRKTRPTDVPTIAALETSTIGERLTTKMEIPPTTTTAASPPTPPKVETTTTAASPPPPTVETTVPPMAETTVAPLETTPVHEAETTRAIVPATESAPVSKPKMTPGPTLPPVDFDCRKKDDGYYADPKDKCSSKWYACVGGLARQLQCSSSDLVWEPETNACERRDDSFRCTGKRKTTLKPTTRRPPPPPVKLPIDCSKSDDGWFPDPLKKCSHLFYSCSNGIGSRFECPGNMYFDKDARMCEAFHDVVACAGKQRKTTRKPITTVKPPVTEKLPIDCTDKNSGAYPDPSKKCSSIYYVCSNGDGYKRTCPDGLFFDVKAKLCDYYDMIFDCSGKTRPPVKPTTPAPKPSPASIPTSEFDCKGKDGKRFTPLDKKCSNVYYRCVGDVTYKLKCPEDLYYDVENDLCDRWSGLFVCSGKKPTSPAPITTVKPKPTEKLPIDCNTYDDGDFPDPEKKCSNVYYSCSNHGGTRRLCPDGLYFDSELYICDLYKNVPDCTGKPRPVTTPAPTNRPSPTNKYPYNCEKKSDGNFESGKCADYYWSCVGGTTIRASCPHGTFYDTEFDHCGYKNEIPACGGVRPTTPKP